MSNFVSKITISAVDKVTTVTRSISRSLDSLKTRTAALSTSMQGLGAASSQFGGKLRSIAVAGTAAGASLFGLVKRTSDVGDAIAKESQRIGISAESLQKFQYAAELGGATADEMSISMRFLSKSIVDSQNPMSEQAKAFKSLGIQVKKANGELKSADEVMLELADKFKNAPDGVKKTNTAMTLLGSRSGTRLIPVLNAGTAELIAQGKELENLGKIYSSEELKAAEQFNDDMTRLQRAVGGVTASIGVALMPALNNVINSITRWVGANRQLLQQRLDSFVTTLADSFKLLWSGLSAVYGVLQPFISMIGGFKTVIAALAGVYIAGLIISFAKMVIAVGAVVKALALLSAAFITTPFGLVVTAIGLIVFGVYKLIKTFSAMGLTVKDFALALIKPFSPLLSVLNLVIKGVNAVKSAFSGVSAPSLSAPALAAPSPAASPRLNAVQNPTVAGRLGVLGAQQPPQKLDISMKIDAQGRPKDVQAKSNAPIDFTANTGVMMP